MAGQAVVGALRVSLGLDSAQFTEGLSAAQRTLRTAGQRLQSIGTGLASVGTGLTAAITAPLVGLGAMAVAEASEMRDALGSVQASLTAMGDVGGQTLESLRGQAEALARTSLFEDDQILRGVTTNLISFGNIAGEQFSRAQQAAVDLAAKLNIDLPAAATLVGRALANPSNAAAVLSRRFGAMPPAIQDSIAALTAMGDTAGAQSVVLDFLNTKIAGQAQAARENAPPLVRMNLALKDMAGTIGATLLPFVDRIAKAFEGLTKKFGTLSPGMQQFVVVAGLAAAALGPLLIAAGAVVASLGVLLPIVGTIGAPFLAVAAAVAAVGVAFWVFRDDIIPIVQSFAASLQENLGPKIAPLWEAIKAAAAAVGDVFSAIFGDGSPGSAAETFKVFGEIIARVLGAAVDVITAGINVITNIFRALGALLRGDFSSMWSYLGQAVMAVARGIVNAFQTLFPEVVSWVRQTYEGVKAWLLDRFTDVVRGIVEKITAVKDAFFNLYDAVVGHSYIPDLVREIADWMGPRLQDAMVSPALSAIDETSTAFDGMASNVSNTMEGLFRSLGSKDWKGVLGSVLDLFAGQDGNGLGGWAKIGSDILGKLPGFKTGATIRPSGAGAADSQLMAFWKSPGEQVDIHRPGQDRGAGGSPVHFDLRGAVMTADLLSQMEGMAQQAAGNMGRQVLDASRRAAPALQNRQRLLGTT